MNRQGYADNYFGVFGMNAKSMSNAWDLHIGYTEDLPKDDIINSLTYSNILGHGLKDGQDIKTINENMIKNGLYEEFIEGLKGILEESGAYQAVCSLWWG